MPTRRALLTLVAAAAASACTSPPALALGSLVEVQIVARDRADVLPAWRHRGASYIAGRPGERYAVRLSNRSGDRVLVVLSIDGVNAVSGETAAVGQTGYVLAPYQTADITGWRKSTSEAAAFYFTALPDSYAARTDRPDNVGVIGAAVFRERSPEPLARWRDRAPQVAEDSAFGRLEAERKAPGAADSAAAPSTTAAPMASARADRQAPQKSEKIGTGHGEREYSPTSQTAFERATQQPAEVVQVRYDSYANLVAAGIIVRHRAAPRQPDAFPNFVPDPG